MNSYIETQVTNMLLMSKKRVIHMEHLCTVVIIYTLPTGEVISESVTLPNKPYNKAQIERLCDLKAKIALEHYMNYELFFKCKE